MTSEPQYDAIYDSASFRKGFQLIVHQSNEKDSIATYLSGHINKNQTVLDLAGGSGAVWEYVAQKRPDFTSQNLSVTLVDSSEEQVREAHNLSRKLPWLTVVKANSVEYIRQATESYDVITMVHFLPGLPAELQKQVVAYAQQKVKSGGIVVVIQPTRENPLSQAKVALRKQLKGEDYKPKYAIVEDEGWNRETIVSTLTVTEEELFDLANFLAETEYSIDSIDEQTREAILSIFKSISKQENNSYRISVPSDYLLWKKV
jgi:ubiquinone/menaquinone biosynthesis C-methylase UbiE